MVEIANALGVGKDLLRHWLAENPRLSAALNRGRERERQALHGRLFKSAMDGNIVAALFLLKCRHAGYDDRGRGLETPTAEETAQQIREALEAMRKATVGG